MCKYVVIDLEMCGVPKYRMTENYRWTRETIPIGAVFLNEEFQIVDEFNTYVKPEYGFINPYIQELTGIGRKDIIAAPTMKTALARFVKWLPAGEVKLVQWSDSDKKQIDYEMLSKAIINERLTDLEDAWIDCQKLFGEKMNSDRQYKLTDALVMANIDTQGEEHNALFDAMNTALLYAKLCSCNELELNPFYREATKEEAIPLSFTLGNMFHNIQLQASA